MRTIFLALLTLAIPSLASARDALPPGFVYLRDVAPGIAQDMRYAARDNFTGHPLPGYGGNECVLKRETALALAKVQADLAAQQLGLKVYDCYRPARATLAMWRWAREPETGATKRFYPDLDKRTLFNGYISGYSMHATGIAVDLTLIRLPARPAASYDPHPPYGACTAPAAERAPDNSLDMGTGFDCFDTRSHTTASNISAEAARSRAVLLTAMRKQGFRNYFREWWHFTYGTPGQHYDFEIPGR